jgi:bidirectional [NiFe] hydrogenase diaphorase subunit
MNPPKSAPMTDRENGKTTAVYDDIDTLIDFSRPDDDTLIEILHAAQQSYGILRRELLRHIAHRLKLPPSFCMALPVFITSSG